MHFIDTHAHLDIAHFDPKSKVYTRSRSDLDLVPLLKRAHTAGVTKIITVSSTFADCFNVIQIAKKHDSVWATVGVHPDDVSNLNDDKITQLGKLILDNRDQVVAIGEIGFEISGHKDQPDIATQEKFFRAQLALARELCLPAIIHTRNADELTLKVLRDFPDLRLVVHCYQSGAELTQAILANPNWYFSFTGIITFPRNVDHILQVVREVPLDKIMIETDSPFLAPPPHRGETNEPAYVIEIARRIAELRNISLAEVADKTTETAELFFGI